MAYEEKLDTISAPASADLSASQFCAVLYNSSGEIALAAANGPMDGVLQDKPEASGRAGCVGINGVTKAVASAAIAAGANVAVATSGQFKTAASTNVVVGRAVTAATGAGSIFSLLIARSIEPAV